MTNYERRITTRGRLRYLLGLFVRWRARRRMDKMISTLRKGGATIGERVALTSHCQLGGGYLMIGDCCSLQDVELDTRAPIKIGSHVILGDRVHILTNSHDIDSPEWTQKPTELRLRIMCGLLQGQWYCRLSSHWTRSGYRRWSSCRKRCPTYGCRCRKSCQNHPISEMCARFARS